VTFLFLFCSLFFPVFAESKEPPGDGSRHGVARGWFPCSFSLCSPPKCRDRDADTDLGYGEVLGLLRCGVSLCLFLFSVCGGTPPFYLSILCLMTGAAPDFPHPPSAFLGSVMVQTPQPPPRAFLSEPLPPGRWGGAEGVLPPYPSKPPG